MGAFSNFHMQTIILHAAPAANNFLCVSVFLQTLLFTCIQFISVFTALQTIYFTIFQPPPPPTPSPSKNNGPPLKIKPCRYSVRADFLLSSFASTGKSFGKKGKTARGSELKSKEQILQARHRKEKMMQRQNKGRPRGKGNKGKFGRKK